MLWSICTAHLLSYIHFSVLFFKVVFLLLAVSSVVPLADVCMHLYMANVKTFQSSLRGHLMADFFNFIFDLFPTSIQVGST